MAREEKEFRVAWPRAVASMFIVEIIGSSVRLTQGKLGLFCDTFPFDFKTKFSTPIYPLTTNPECDRLQE